MKSRQLLPTTKVQWSGSVRNQISILLLTMSWAITVLENVITADEVSKLVTLRKPIRKPLPLIRLKLSAQLNQFKQQAEQQISATYKNLQDSGILEKLVPSLKIFGKGLTGLFA